VQVLRTRGRGELKPLRTVLRAAWWGNIAVLPGVGDKHGGGGPAGIKNINTYVIIRALHGIEVGNTIPIYRMAPVT